MSSSDTERKTRTSSKRFVCGIRERREIGRTTFRPTTRPVFENIFYSSRHFGGRRRNAFKSRVKPNRRTNRRYKLASYTRRPVSTGSNHIRCRRQYRLHAVFRAAAAAGLETSTRHRRRRTARGRGGEGARAGTATFAPSDARAHTHVGSPTGARC